MNSVRCMASGMSLKVQPYVLAVGGGNGSCRLTGLWQTVRGASNPMAVDNCYGNWWSEKFTTTGRRRWFPAWSWTKDCTAHDQATLEPKVKVPYWHGMSELCFKQARPHKWKLETGQQDITTVTKQRRWKLLGHVIRKGRDSITRTVLRWTPDSGRRKRGRPRETCGSMRQKWKQQGRHGKNSRR